MKTPWLLLALPLFAAPFTVGGLGCSTNDEAYKPVPAHSGPKPNLPPVPQVPQTPIKQGDAFTVYGAVHHLRSSIHSNEVTTKPISIVGYIVGSNIPAAPKCAIHKTGQKDPDDCKTEIPGFYLSDTKEGTQGPKIRVLGWASNFANVHDAMEKYRNLKEPPKELYKDGAWGMDVPFPLPADGAKVKVTGKYGFTFSRASGGLVSEPQSGIVSFEKMDQLEPPPSPAAFASAK